MIVDDRGRLFGRVNVIDGMLGLVVLVMLASGWATVRLFRQTPPVIVSVEPASQLVGPTPRLTMSGRNLRPYLRVFVVAVGRRPSLVERDRERTEGHVHAESPEALDLELPAGLGAGTYDMYLYDETREVARLARAFELTAPPIPETQLLTIRVRALVDSSLVGVVKRGDRDVGERAQGLPAATLLRVDAVVDWTEWPKRVLRLEVRLPATRGVDGVMRAGHQVIRAGEEYTFQTQRYVVHGQILPVWGP